jgi:hypothetical protein
MGEDRVQAEAGQVIEPRPEGTGGWWASEGT